jgi:uncharacterized protein
MSGRNLSALLAGLLFGAGLAVSGMVDPGKVLGFLDVAGRWDPSLAFVMAGALAVAIPGLRLARGRGAPAFGGAFDAPPGLPIERELLAGAALFGLGWGLVGFCPGPAIAALAYGRAEPFLFVAAMAAGAWLYRRQAGRSRPAPSPT